MVYFIDISSSGKKYLVISKDQNDATEKGLSLLIEKPVIGQFSPVWPKQNDLGDIVEWTYDTSQNPDSPSRAWSLRSIKKGIRHASLDKVLELWRSCTKSKTMSQAFFLAPPSNLKHHTTQSYERWWNSTHGTYLEDGIASLISSTRPPLPRTKTGQINCDKNDNEGGIQLSDDHITRVVQKSVIDKAQFVKPQDVIVKPKISPFKAFLVEGPPGVCMASNEKMDSYLVKVSESSDGECHWRRAKKKLKLIAPSEPDFIEGTSYAFEHVEVAADQMPSTKFMERTVSSDIPEDSVYRAENVILRNRIDLALNLWKNLQQRIVRTPFEKAPSLMGEAQKIFDAIAANKAMDPSPLQSLVADYFEKARSFESLQSSFSTSVMSEQRDKQLADCNFRLAEQSTIKNELIACGEIFRDGLASVEAKTVQLQEKLEHLSNRKKDLKASILNNDEKLSNQSSIISNIQDEISFIETTPSLSNADIESLQFLKQGLETARDELENYNRKY
nr:hypothetical protein CFP56_02181 [Quercus suber]